MKWLTLFTAILLAACAAWFSIVGIMTIFSGAALSVMIMAGVLEIGKLVSAAWLHYEWERINVLTRAYFTTAILILMFITSMGIFGYLSKAHIEQSVKAGGNNELQMQNLERQIARQQSIITDSETVLSQLDSQVQTLIEYDRIRGPSGSIATRQGQAEERKGLNESIDVAYIRIEELQTELAPLQQEKLELEVEIGPLKYIAEFVYGKENAADYFDVAVRWIIILLVVVFDPLAIMLLIVSTGAFKRDRLKINPLVNEDQIMRMDIDDGNSSDGSTGNGHDVSEEPRADADKESGRNEEASSNNSSEGRSTADSGLYVRQGRAIDVFGSPEILDQHAGVEDKYLQETKGLTTVMSRRPV
jgi:hypothetical protein